MKVINRLEDVQGIQEEELIETPEGYEGIFLGVVKNGNNKDVVRVMRDFLGDIRIIQYRKDSNGNLYNTGVEPHVYFSEEYMDELWGKYTF